MAKRQSKASDKLGTYYQTCVHLNTKHGITLAETNKLQYNQRGNGLRLILIKSPISRETLRQLIPWEKLS